MRIIYPNLALWVSNTSEKEDYVGNYCTSKHLLETWRPSDSDSNPTIVIKSKSKANTVFIGNIKGESATITIKNSTGITIKTVNVDLIDYDEFYGEFEISKFWIDYETQEANHTVTIVITRGSVPIVEIGMVFIGLTLQPFGDPQWGVSGTMQDFSVLYNLDRGIKDSAPSNKLDSMSISHDIESDVEFYALKRKLKQIGKEPAVWRLCDDSYNEDFDHENIIYGMMTSDFSWNIQQYSQKKIDYTVEEFL